MKYFKVGLLSAIFITVGGILAGWAGSLPENREDKYVLLVSFISVTVIAVILSFAIDNDNKAKMEIADLRAANQSKDEGLRKITENRDGLIQQCETLKKENREQEASSTAYYQGIIEIQWALLALPQSEQQDIISRDVRRKFGQEDRKLS